jgi:hypothetical protein
MVDGEKIVVSLEREAEDDGDILLAECSNCISDCARNRVHQKFHSHDYEMCIDGAWHLVRESDIIEFKKYDSAVKFLSSYDF